MRRILLTAVLGLLVSAAALAQAPYVKPRLEHQGSWSMIMVPDIQNYVKWSRNRPLLDLMMAWIEDHIDSLNIKMVVGVGDLVENNEKITNDYDGNQSTQQQWESASKAFSMLDGKVPYIAATGNHDYSIDRQGHRSSHYATYFNADNNHLNKKFLVQNTRNEAGQPTVENAAYELKNLNGKDYLFMTVEYGPRDSVLNWARRVADMKQYKDHRVVLITHNYLNTKGQHTGGKINWLYWEPYNVDNVIQKSAKIEMPHANNGQQIWEKLVQPASNIEMVLCGHISGEGYRRDANASGTSVHQILFDAQSMGGGHRYGNGGDGWLRILEFFPDGRTVQIKTFSTLFGVSPATQSLAWKKDKRNEFRIQFD